MRSAVLDTSVLIKWVHQEDEENLGEALLLRKAYLDGKLEIIIPDLAIYEFSNFLRFRSGLPAALMQRLLDDFWSLGISIFPVDRELSQRALHFASLYSLTVYDGAFVALSSLLETTLVTADRKLHVSVSGKEAVLLLAELGRRS
ncbi:MAG: type II toxin-antitoxin system VapC family toxin [Thermoleophilia bacterium]